MKFLLISLAIVLLASALVSIVFLSANTFDSSLVGHATVSNGTVTIMIDDTLEISLTNETINFGTCALNLSEGYALLDSSLSNDSVNNADCFGGVFPSFLVVRNIGNILANVSVSFNESGNDFFKDSDSWLAYMTNNTTATGGCVGNLQNLFVNITTANTSSLACDNLNYMGLQEEFALYLKAYVNASATGGGELLVTFSAQPVS